MYDRMPMQAESLEVLEKASVAPAQARAIVRAIEIELEGAKGTLATKQDLVGVEQKIEALRQEFAVFRAELRGELEKLRAEMHRTVGGVARQMYLAILGQMAVMLGFAYFFATHLR
jgi:hypothetical protein